MYTLMNQDTPLLEFDIAEQIGNDVCLEKKRYSDRLPFGFIDINTWVYSRNTVRYKDHFRKWQRPWNLNRIKGFVDITRGLSLNDTFWIKKTGSRITWAQVNLYHNNFMDIGLQTGFEPANHHGLRLSSTSPEFTSDGTFRKGWIWQPGQIMLLKRSSVETDENGMDDNGIESYSEYYASIFAKALCHEAVNYNLINYKGLICSICDIFTNEREGFVPVYKMLTPGKQYNLASMLYLCRSLGFEDEFRRMVILDAIILNPDRGMDNFGFIFDTKSLQIKQFAPIFDHNRSLLCKATELDLIEPEDYYAFMEHKMGGDFIYVAKKLMTEEIRAILESLLKKDFPRHFAYNLPEKRLEILNDIVRKQIRKCLE